MTIIQKYNLTRFDSEISTSSNPYSVPTKTLKLGSVGSSVKWLQYELNRIYGIQLVVDGKFGKNTKKQVIKFQQEHKDINGNALVVDGIVGTKTRQAIIRA